MSTPSGTPPTSQTGEQPRPSNCRCRHLDHDQPDHPTDADPTDAAVGLCVGSRPECLGSQGAAHGSHDPRG